MTILAFDFLHDDPPTVKMYETKREAGNQRNDYFFPEDAAALANQNILAPTNKILELYNSLADEPVARFSDRLVAAKRLFELCNSKLQPEGNNMATKTATKATPNKALAKADGAKRAAAEATTATKAAKAAKKAEGTGQRGRLSNNAGKKLIATKQTRREGTMAYASLQLIIDAGKGGILYEDWLKGGGRIADLNYDIKHGVVTVK